MKANLQFWDKIKTVGIRLNYSPAVIRKWKSRGWVPASRHYEILENAPKAKINITLKELNQQAPH